MTERTKGQDPVGLSKYYWLSKQVDKTIQLPTHKNYVELWTLSEVGAAIQNVYFAKA